MNPIMSRMQSQLIPTRFWRRLRKIPLAPLVFRGVKRMWLPWRPPVVPNQASGVMLLLTRPKRTFVFLLICEFHTLSILRQVALRHFLLYTYLFAVVLMYFAYALHPLFISIKWKVLDTFTWPDSTLKTILGASALAQDQEGEKIDQGQEG